VQREIILPETTPETEWVRGRPLQKVSPTRGHGRLQLRFAQALERCAAEFGQVATEWRFRLAPKGSTRRPLVPDVAFVRNERLRELSVDEAEAPLFAPDVAVEILSPDDRRADVEDKVAVYLATGSTLVVLVDGRARTVTLIDASRRQTLDGDAVIEHAALPGFALALAELFAALDLPT
jgi:Uma2 family endonuclease